MNKIIATIIATITLLLASSVAVATPASASAGDLVRCTEVPNPTEFTGECDPGSSDLVRCTEVPNPTEFTGICAGPIEVESPAACATDQTATSFRTELAVAWAKVKRLERVADRRAATIKRLRAKLKAARR